MERKKEKIRSTHKAARQQQLNNKVAVTHKPVFYPASVQWSDVVTIRQFHRCRKPVQPLSHQKLIRNHYSHWSRMVSRIGKWNRPQQYLNNSQLTIVSGIAAQSVSPWDLALEWVTVCLYSLGPWWTGWSLCVCLCVMLALAPYLLFVYLP